MIRVVVAEDSPTARMLLVRILGSDPEIRVVAEARDGVEAVELTQRLRPDLVTMDIQMPRMDGLEATREIMYTTPTPIVIISGSVRAREVESSMDMLRIGALDVLVKPPSPSSDGYAGAVRRLIGTVKTMSRVKVERHRRPPPAPIAPPTPTVARPPGVASCRAVAIASSTGGPAALQNLLSGLPVGFPAPILVVQHIAPGFTAGLASWLASVCHLRVKVAEDGEPPGPATVYIAPDDRHLGVSARGSIALSADPEIGGFRPSGTYLFDSVARAFGPSAVAVILTGMGSDGVEGLREVRRAGGRVIAQDERTSIVFGMPRAAIAAGLADAILPLEAIAPRLIAST